VANKQRERLANLRRDRDNVKVKAALSNLEGIAKGTDNTVPAFMECVAAYATIGEIGDVLRGVLGAPREFGSLSLHLIRQKGKKGGNK
jgi:methylmalonyl-CoA mutase N-terminal domain/subunit